MSQHPEGIEEHDLPSIEAALAGTLVLMTGYSQALQADLHPRQRVAMAVKIASNLSLLATQAQLSDAFRLILLGLQRRWCAMTECTHEAARSCAAGTARAADGPPPFQLAAPPRLQ